MNLFIAFRHNCLLDMLSRRGSLDQGKRILEDRTNQQGRKRKRLDDVSSCVTNGQDDGEVCLKKNRKAGEHGICSCSQTCALLNKRLSAYAKEPGMLLKDILSGGRGLGRGTLLPVRDLFGQAPSVALERLQALLQGNEVGRIAINGTKGIGKTFIMKHLHKSAPTWGERFDHVIWVTCPREFSIKRVQDAVAAALECRLCSDADVITRAGKLLDVFAGLGRFVILVDDVPEVHFSLAQIGIPVPVEGGASKLVITSRSTLVSRMFECSGIVNLKRLTNGEACQLFLDEARISEETAPSLEDIPNSLAKKCDGVPGKIIDMAIRMRGIDDLREWKHELFEFRG